MVDRQILKAFLQNIGQAKFTAPSHSYNVLCSAAREYRGGGRRVAGCRGSGQLANRRLGGLVIR